jgi:hypothetical protein
MAGITLVIKPDNLSRSFSKKDDSSSICAIAQRKELEKARV